MDTQVQSSFIPKKSLAGTAARRSGAAMGTFIILIAVLIFIASLVSAGGAFAYQGYLQNSISQKAQTLQTAESAFDPATIQDLTRLDSRINNAEDLLQKHLSMLAIFNFLSQQTLTNVQFTGFTFEEQTDGTANLTLTGLADGFSTVALQSDQFGASKMLKDVVFSNILVNTNSKVGFNVKATVDPSLVNYAKNLTGSVPTATSQTPSVNVTTATSPVALPVPPAPLTPQP
jgi:hypothetical protein